MKEKKICIGCNEEKLIELFPQYKKRNGDVSYKNKCKMCTALRDKEYKQRMRGESKSVNKNTISTVNVLRQPTKTNIVEKRSASMVSVFSSDEIKRIKEMLANYENNKIIFEKIEDVKDKKCISISKELNNKVSKLSNKTGLNYSQTIESLIKKGLEYI